VVAGTAGGVGKSSNVEWLTDVPEFRRVRHLRKTFARVPRETVSQFGVGADLGRSEWPKQVDDVPSCPLELLSTGGDQDPCSYFPDSF